VAAKLDETQNEYIGCNIRNAIYEKMRKTNGYESVSNIGNFGDLQLVQLWFEADKMVIGYDNILLFSTFVESKQYQLLLQEGSRNTVRSYDDDDVVVVVVVVVE
jgi:hypothetical protein